LSHIKGHDFVVEKNALDNEVKSYQSIVFPSATFHIRDRRISGLFPMDLMQVMRKQEDTSTNIRRDNDMKIFRAIS
jgi:hypothetical protein